MAFAQFAPAWFFGIDIILQFLFALIALGISLFSFKIYKATDQKQVKLFGLGFLFISISYFIQSLFNFFIVSKTTQPICTALTTNYVILFDYIGMISHIILMTAGLTVILYTTLKTDKDYLIALLIGISLFAIYMSQNYFLTFFLLSSIYLGIIFFHYVSNYLKHKKKNTLLVAVAFGFLFFGSAHFIFSLNHQLFYALGHILELIAYILISLNLYMVQRK